MVMIFKDAYEDLTPERLAYIIDRFDAGRPEDINTGPADQAHLLCASRRPDHPDRRDQARQQKRRCERGTKAKGKIAGCHQSPAKAEGGLDGDRYKISRQGESQREGRCQDGCRGHGCTEDECCAQGIGDRQGKFDLGCRVNTAKSVTSAKQTGGKEATVTKGNPTMAVAATASGRAKAASTKLAAPKPGSCERCPVT
jgi:NADH-quinone oxidoreductase subunit E